MLEAGVRVFEGSGIVDDLSGSDMLLVAEIYLAVLSASHHPSVVRDPKMNETLNRSE
jgi:hypothetical protein